MLQPSMWEFLSQSCDILMYNWHNHIINFKPGEELKLCRDIFWKFYKLLDWFRVLGGKNVGSRAQFNTSRPTWCNLVNKHFVRLPLFSFFCETGFVNILLAWVWKIIYYLFVFPRANPIQDCSSLKQWLQHMK